MSRLAPAMRRWGLAVAVWLPVIIVFGGVGALADLTSARATYSSNYPVPRTLGKVSAASLYSARPLSTGGWQVFGLDSRSNVSLRTISRRGRTVHETIADRNGDIPSAPSVAWGTRSSLGAWVSENGSATLPLKVELFGTGPDRAITATHYGAAGDPYVVTDPRGGFEVLFTWQRSVAGNADIYAIHVSERGHLGMPERLARSSEVGISPVGDWDSQGDLDVAYVEDCCNYSALDLMYGRFTRSFKSIGRPRTIDQIPPESDSSASQFGLAIESGSKGRIWLAWDGSSGLELARSFHGGVRIVDRLASVTPDPLAPAVSLALLRSGGSIFYSTQGPLGSYLDAARFDRHGRWTSIERVSYSGNAVDPSSAVVAGRVHVFWLDTGSTSSVLIRATKYQHRVSPSLIDRAGMGVGNPWIDLFLIVAGSLMAAIPLTIINVLVLAPLFVLWFPVSRLIGDRFGWIIHTAIVGAALALLVEVRWQPNHWLVLMTPLGTPFGLIAVAGSIFVGVWISRVVLRDQEALSRVAVLVLVSFYFVAAMWTVGRIEGSMTLV